ncbi:MAG: LacI family transcriptional regulator [Ruminococcaceae bacterium]|nr:LacI family transcriptional regulator [Oscillospiraceae bacterium]
MRQPTIHDVAKHAGVSSATVSHVLNNTRRVSEKTRLRVMDSVKELDYRPNLQAQMFRSGKKYLIGFIVPDISNNFWAVIIEAIETVLARQGYKLLLVNTKKTYTREVENVRILSSGICDGLIIASTVTDWRDLQEVLPHNYPIVLLDRKLNGSPWENLTISNYNSVYTGVEHLIIHGHSRIGFITGLEHLSTSKERLSAYKDALTENNIKIDDSIIRYGDSMAMSVFRHVDAILEANCTAIVVSNNVMTQDTVYYLTEKGLRVGTDIVVLGYREQGQNDHDLRFMSLISQPSEELGRIAGERILAHVENPDTIIQNVVLYSTYTRRSG